jgi:hypothetical protein
MAGEEAPEFRTVAIVTGMASVLTVVFPSFAPLVLATLSWAALSFVQFGRRGWAILALALPSLLWPIVMFVRSNFGRGFVD